MPSVEVLRESLGKIAVLVHPVKKNGLAYVVIGHAYDADDPTVQRLVEYVKDTRPTRSYVMSVAEANELVERQCQ
jgi:hypothetical protein